MIACSLKGHGTFEFVFASISAWCLKSIRCVRKRYFKTVFYSLFSLPFSKRNSEKSFTHLMHIRAAMQCEEPTLEIEPTFFRPISVTIKSVLHQTTWKDMFVGYFMVFEWYYWEITFFFDSLKYHSIWSKKNIDLESL